MVFNNSYPLSDNEKTFNYSVYEKLGLTLSEPSSPITLSPPPPSLSDALEKHHREDNAVNWLESTDGKRYLAAKLAREKICVGGDVI